MKAQRRSSGIALLFNLGARWDGWLTPRLGRFTPGKKSRYLLYRRLVGPDGRSGRLRKFSPPRGFEPLTTSPWRSRYTDYAIQTNLGLGNIGYYSKYQIKQTAVNESEFLSEHFS